MKNFIKFILCIFVLAISLLIGTSALSTQNLKAEMSLNSIKKESVFLSSSNLLSNKILIRKKNSTSNFLASTPITFSDFSYKISFNYINSQFNWEFFYHLSNSIKKGLYIRAP